MSNMTTGNRGVETIKAEHADDQFDADQFDTKVIIESYQNMVNTASTLIEDDIRDKNPEYLRGMAELIAYSHGMNGDHVENIEDDILDNVS